MSYARIADHRSMALDLQRNRAYYNALKTSVTPDTVVLDLGAGIGVHGLLAAQLGAKRVYCVEPEDIIRVAEQIAGANGLAERMVFLHGRIEEVALPEPVDLIVSVFTGNMLLTEDLLPSLFYARDRYLKPGGHLLPGRARLEAVPVSTPEIYNREVASWSRPHLGLDLSVARPFAAHTAYYRLKDTRQAEYLAEPQPLLTLDFATAHDIHCDQSVTFTINRAGECHGFMGWFAMELGADWLSTAPHQPEMHWTP
ncbi:MAG: methyltransferase domain-containing protein, partial [Anaerolineae bacterium]|nr:methyltransferase domain-containing protein [Anaerolineae bacterium]